MKFTLIVNDAPYQSQSSDSAWQFSCALLQEGHELEQVFFYSEGVWNACAKASPPQDDRNVIANWSVLAERTETKLIVCSGSAQRRGVKQPLAPGFQLASLARLSEAIALSDRVITFGAQR